MTFEELAAAAKDPDFQPEKTMLPEDRAVWLCLRGIAVRSREQVSPREELLKEVDQLRGLHRALTLDHNRQRAAWAQYQEFLRRADGLTYEMKRALESRPEASAVVSLALDLYAALTGDGTMAENMKGMIK